LGVKKYFFLVSLILFISLACTDETERSSGLVNFFMIGSGGDFDEIWLEILGVEVKTTGSRGTDDTQPVFLPNIQSNKRVNIAGFTANSQFLIGRSEFSEGSITNINLILGDNNSVVLNGQEFPIQFSNTAEENLSFPVNFPISGGISHDVILDFDAFRSFLISEGLEPNIIMNPLIRPFLSLERGRANGNISPTNIRVAIIATDEEDSIITTTQPQSGNFSLRGLEEGIMYRAYIVPFDQSYRPELVDSIQVTERSITQLESITLILNTED
jgi:hypothetical protein